MATPYELRSYPGAAGATKLQGGITNTAFSFTVQAGTGGGYPDGTAGPFFVVIDPNTTSEEKLHCTGRVGDSFTADQRGADGTTAFPHSDQAVVEACFTATDAQEANVAAHNTVGQVTTKGDLLSGSAVASLVRTGVGADGATLTADSSQTGGVRWDATTVPGLSASVATLQTNQAVDETTIAGHTTELAAHAAQFTKLGTPLSGTLGTTKTSTGTILTIGSLGVGKWLVNVVAQCEAQQQDGSAVILATPGSGITLSGAFDVVYVAGGDGNDQGTAALTFIATVGTSGNVVIGATLLHCFIAGGSNQTGYTAIQIA